MTEIDTRSDHRISTRRRPLLAAAALVGAFAAPLRCLEQARAQSTEIQGRDQDQDQDQDQDDEVNGERTRYFAESGHNLKNPFLARWEDAGGEDVFGIPLSEERYAEGTGVVQTFEAMTLVYDPALQAPWDLQGVHLTNEDRRDVAPSSARKQVSGCTGSGSCRYFPETGHTLAGGFASFWYDSGELAIIGMPVSEPFEEEATGLTVQVFERAVLEREGSGKVRLRRLAAQQVEGDGLLADPAFKPTPPTGGTTTLVQASDGLRLRTGPSLEADIQVVLPDNAEFVAVPSSRGEWVPGYADGYSGWVASDYLKEPEPLPERSRSDWNPNVWQGAALSETNVRAQPTTASEVVEVFEYGEPVEVTAWVKGEEVFEGADLWAQVGTNRFIYARNVGRNAPVQPPPLPSDAPNNGKWVDVHLTQQLMTAYDARKVVRVTATTTGMAGWETPPGFYQILSRVANETMTSGAIGAEHYYKLEDVLFTQYFSNRGHAIHFAWWRTPETIGRPGSHGCLNLLLDDSRFLWDWAGIGTPVYVHP